MSGIYLIVELQLRSTVSKPSLVNLRAFNIYGKHELHFVPILFLHDDD